MDKKKSDGQKMSLTISVNQLYYKGNQQGGEQWLT